jgi:hypothetical protein
MKYYLTMTVLLASMLVYSKSPAETKKDGKQFSAKDAKKGSAKLMAKDLVGKWRLVNVSGKDAGDFIEEIEFVFRKDGTFIASATIKEEGVESYKGTYGVKGTKLRMKVSGKPDLLCPCRLRNGHLFMKDSSLDAEMKFVRVPLRKEDKTKVEAAKKK